MKPVNRIRSYLPRAQPLAPPPQPPGASAPLHRMVVDYNHSFIVAALLIGFTAGAISGLSAGHLLRLLFEFWQP